MTVADLVKQTLQDLGIIQAGEEPAGEDADLALSRTQDWIDGLALENLTAYTKARTTWTITQASSFTIGSGGTINVARPVSPEDIENIGYQDTSLTPTTETLLGRPMTEDQYAQVAQKALTAVYPQAFYYRPDFPLGAILPFPIPTSSTLQGVIYTAAPLTEPAALSDTLLLPPGYRRFYRTNLRIEFADAFEKPVTRKQVLEADAAKRWVKRRNVRLVDLQVPDAAYYGNGRQSNIYTGID